MLISDTRRMRPAKCCLLFICDFNRSIAQILLLMKSRVGVFCGFVGGFLLVFHLLDFLSCRPEISEDCF